MASFNTILWWAPKSARSLGILTLRRMTVFRGHKACWSERSHTGGGRETHSLVSWLSISIFMTSQDLGKISPLGKEAEWNYKIDVTSQKKKSICFSPVSLSYKFLNKNTTYFFKGSNYLFSTYFFFSVCSYSPSSLVLCLHTWLPASKWNE